MGPLDSTIVSVSLPIISSELDMDYATSVWIPTAYLLAVSSLLLTPAGCPISGAANPCSS
jgi:hypothetical protein